MNETEAGLSERPDGWMWTTIEKVIQIIDYRGRTPPYSSEGIPHLRSANIKNGNIIWNNLKYVTKETYNKYMTRGLPKQGDLLFTTEAPLGEVAFAPNKKFSLAQRIMILRPLEDIIKPEFLLYQIQTANFQEKLRISETGSVVKGISSRNFKPFPIIIPPLPEQHRIVTKIEELFTKLDAGINELHKAQSQLKRYRQSVLKAAFEGKLTKTWRAKHQDEIEPVSVLLERILKERREKWEAEQLEGMKAKGKMPKDNRWKAKYKEPIAPDTSNLPELPNGWVWTTLPQIGELNRGKSKNRPRNAPFLYGGRYPFVQTGDIRQANGLIRHYNLTYSEEGLKQSRLWPAGTLCITIAANIADTAILGFNACFPDSMVGFLPEREQCNIYFVEFFLRTAKEDLERYAPATAQKNINLAILKDLAIPFPSLAEQNIIAQEIDRYLSVADEVEKTITAELKRAEQLRQSILKKAFSGKLVPQDPNDEPASVLLERIKAEKSENIQGQLRLNV